ncbi:hypothetical protein DSO57_1031748 [Entomophthora muscae]|uniref:Uncharacterized protein n=1 Tax=Entomophthora muscae TaxID=34485 RepID=A0ACC2TC47_9FUNG|nr:hypothetical protein DSO57_1031748 [Entomophthora muscae]
MKLGWLFFVQCSLGGCEKSAGFNMTGCLGSSQPRAAAEPFFDDYRSYNEILENLYSWTAEYPGISRLYSVGVTHDNHDMIVFTIKSQFPSAAKRAIWINAGLHGQEWVAPATGLFIIRSLLLNSNTLRVRKLLDKFDFYFTPLANPDGYEVTRIVGSRLFSKNRRKNPGGSFGVDLGRNWDVHWSEVGGYDIYESNFYYGPSAQSEPEVRALASFALAIPNRFFGFDLGSYGQRILYPTAWQDLPAKGDVIRIANVISTSMKKSSLVYEVMQAYSLVPMAGTLLDWMASRAGMNALTIQLCPFSTSVIGYHYPPRLMVQCASATYTALLDAFDAL